MFSLKKILVVGSANVDFVIGVRQAPELGETILCRSFRKTCGGKGANQAYACGRLGGDTAFLNAVGDDPLGDIPIYFFQSLSDGIAAEPSQR